MTAKLFEAALGIAGPWSVKTVKFDEADKVLTVLIDFEPGIVSRSLVMGACTRCTTQSPRSIGT